jgi:2-iminobutanoate/2-iminopropanoate deaminase
MKKYFIVLSMLALLSALSCNTVEKEEKTTRRVITLENTPAKRPYSPAIEAENTLYVSGQIAVDPSTEKLIEGGIEEQTRQVLKNLKNVIEKAGYNMESTVKCTVLLSDIAFYATVNQIYMEFFPKDPPARVAFAVKDLPKGALIEIDAIVVK